ncbi:MULTISPECIES: hypothetical protein [Citrobacter freundii complex]|nr:MULTISPECIES: hypothetical protein [Citrobacter]
MFNDFAAWLTDPCSTTRQKYRKRFKSIIITRGLTYRQYHTYQKK